MNPSGLTPWKVQRWGGHADWDDATNIPNGMAIKAQHCRFRAESTATRFGRKTTMTYATVAADVTGLECLNVLGFYASQIPLVWLTSGGAGATGILLKESPAGSGTLVPVVQPLPLPSGGHLMVAMAYNRAYMTDTDMKAGLVLPVVLDGPTGKLTPISQNTPGALWQAATRYFAGDLVRMSSNPLRWFMAGNSGLSGASEPLWPVFDGYMNGTLQVAATVLDNAGANQILWTEWTPGIASYLPTPEHPESIISIKGQPGAPGGTIANAQDVYVAFSYTHGGFESAWTAPIKFTNTAANDVLEIFFQTNTQTPGPNIPPAYNAAGYGGPRQPAWLMSINIPLVGGVPAVDPSTDPLIGWPTGNYMNVYVAAVATGAGAPTTYKRYATVAPTAPVIVTAISGAGSHTQVTTPTGALANLQFLGTAGERNLIVLRTDFNDSLSPADPGAVLPVQFGGVATAAPSGASRSGTGLVTIQLPDIRGLVPAGIMSYFGAADATFNISNGTIASVTPGVYPGGTVTVQTATMSAASTTGGAVTIPPGPPPVVVLPPGYNDALDVVALTVQGGGVGGPFTWIPEAIPLQQFSTSVTSLVAAAGSATINVGNPNVIQAGNVIVLASTGSPLDGVLLVVASVNNNSVVLNDTTNSTFTGTNLSASLTVQQVLPTSQPFSQAGVANANITHLSLLTNGQVQVHVDNASFFSPGHRVAAFNSGDGTLDRQIGVIQTVVPDAQGNGGTITWLSTILNAPFTGTQGVIIAAPGIILNFDDNSLADSEDVTSQLTAIGAPLSIDITYSKNLDRMVYTPGSSTSLYFSNIGDAENIQNPDGLLGIDQSNGFTVVCFREMQNGELLALKENGAYVISPSENPPSQWGVASRWDEHGPVGPDAAKVSTDFMIIFARRTGPYRYFQGQLTWIGHEKQGTWDKVNWDAAKEVQVEIDADNKRVFFGIPINGSTTVNYWEVLDYSMGWDDPLIVMLDGSTKPNRYARRWSEWPLSARKVRAVKRTLAVPVDPRINAKQLLVGIAAGTIGGLPKSLVQMEQPDVYSDDSLTGGAATGIDAQYIPAYARSQPGAGSKQSPQTGVGIESWEMVAGRARGNGPMILTPVTDDPTFGTQNQITVQLTPPAGKTAGTPIKFAKSFPEQIECELLSLNFNNGKVAGNWFELHEAILYSQEKYPCKQGEAETV